MNNGLSLDECFWFGPLYKLVILTMAIGHKFTRKEHFLASMKFSHTFQLFRMESDVVLKQFTLNILILI